MLVSSSKTNYRKLYMFKPQQIKNKLFYLVRPLNKVRTMLENAPSKEKDKSICQVKSCRKELANEKLPQEDQLKCLIQWIRKLRILHRRKQTTILSTKFWYCILGSLHSINHHRTTDTLFIGGLRLLQSEDQLIIRIIQEPQRRSSHHLHRV